MLVRPPFPAVIDSSLMGDFRACPQRAFRKYLQHWKPAAESVHLIAGKAFASGVEVAREGFYVRGRPTEECIEDGLHALWLEYGYFTQPEDSPKSPLRMAAALEYYFDRYPLGNDGATPKIFAGGKHGIEFSFSNPLPITHPTLPGYELRHPETGDPLLYCGRADMVADVKTLGGMLIYDEKTTTSLGKSWRESWDLRSQFTSYCWGLRDHGINPSGIVVRGVAILKTDFNTEQVVSYRSTYEVELWLAQVFRDLRRMIEMWREGYWDYNLDHACTEYGGCAFRRVCKSANPDAWLTTQFKRRRWDPVLRVETDLE